MPPKSNKAPSAATKVKPPLDLQRAQELNAQVLKRKDPEIDEVCLGDGCMHGRAPKHISWLLHRSLALLGTWCCMTLTSRPKDGYGEAMVLP